MNTQRSSVRKRTFQTATDGDGRTLVRVEGFVAGGVKWARCINQKSVPDFANRYYVESTYVPEAAWRTMQDDYIDVFVREKE